MIRHVYDRALRSGAEAVIVATDDERVCETVLNFGGEVCMTASWHRSGTERLAEAVSILREPDERVIVNVQGDEPMIPPALIRQVANNLARHPAVDITTLCDRIVDRAVLFDPGVVKVVVDRQGLALYFSRAPIPWYRDHFATAPDLLPAASSHFRHIGIYGYRAGYLKQYAEAPPSPLELAEALEQLRALYHGGRIHVAEAVEWPGLGVDTPEDYTRVCQLLS